MIQVSVYDKKITRRIMEAAKGETLMQLLGRYDVFFDANCGGTGRCHQCKVLVDGVRTKACQYQINRECKVVLPFAFSKEFKVVMGEEKNAGQAPLLEADGMHSSSLPCWEDELQYYICVDLGTTTIGMALVDEKRRIRAQFGCPNAQRSYGSDVGERIRYASTEEGLETLQQLALADIKRGKSALCKEAGSDDTEGVDIYVSGNTTMLHILAGHSPKSIGSYPFIPEHKEAQCIAVPKLGTLHLLPCASGYIGSDVTVGACYYHLHHKEQPTLYIDLGTNGEMLLGDRTHILSASVAAGPAFEQMLKGADALQALAAMREQGIMDEQGTLAEPYFEQGYHYTSEAVAGQNGDGQRIDTIITQDDIRQLQLAKGAVRAGIELICERFGCRIEEIARVYVAGGFGFFLKEKDAIFLKMFPACFEGKIEVIGNASLHGNIACHNLLKELTDFNDSIVAIDLAKEEYFQECYVSYMSF